MVAHEQQERFTHYAVVVDSNILLAHPQIEKIDWGIKPITVFILDSVLHEELEGLRRSSNESVAQRAQGAFDHLCALEQHMDEDGYDVLGGTLRIAPVPRRLPAPGAVRARRRGPAANWLRL